MKLFQTRTFLAILSLCLWGTVSFAIEEAKILPQGIHSPIVRTGIVDGLDQRFTSEGDLAGLSRFYSVEVDAQLLRQESYEADQFIKILNQFPGQLGDQLHLGTIIPKLEPELSYYGPIYSIGQTKNLTLALGVPIFHYKNNLDFAVTGSNVGEVRALVQGDVSLFDNAFNQLNINIIDNLKGKLSAAGYTYDKRDEWIVGDVQLASLYQVLRTSDWAVLLKGVLNLPTGPKDDPSDLIDLDFLGQTAVELNSLAQTWMNKKFSLLGRIGYRYHIEDQVEKRIPKASSDQLPGPETQETVDRKLGDIASVELKSLYSPINYLLIEAGISHSEKFSDRYSGSRASNYNILSEGTNSNWNTLVLGAELNTIDMYKSQKFSVPLLLAYHFNDVFAGVNKEKQTIHEISLSLFF